MALTLTNIRIDSKFLDQGLQKNDRYRRGACYAIYLHYTFGNYAVKKGNFSEGVHSKLDSFSPKVSKVSPVAMNPHQDNLHLGIFQVSPALPLSRQG